ncbi:MAG: homogentisate phytyltransferase [Hormoscilla sp. GM7CHS1pb]|nr:homogentisate phytyltransferase [Hormoscilla sp. GM7CHS1pb]
MSQISDIQSPGEQLGAVRQVRQWFYSLWKFSRPHTIIGTTLSVVALYAIAVAQEPDLPLGSGGIQLLGTLVACWCGNVYIVGLNQLCDVEIDKINKPHLPVAAGEFSRRTAQSIVAITGIGALLLAALTGPWLLGTVGISLAMGTAYSLPPVRLKRFPFWAGFCIYTVRGLVVNLGLFWHFSWTLSDATISVPPVVLALTLFILGFTFAIAIFKDIPDMEGDRIYNISTFTLRLGAKVVFYLGLGAISACYLSAIVVGLLGIKGVNSIGLAVSHFLALGLLWWCSFDVDLQDKKAIASFYQFIWKLFFLEYLIFPAACLFK